MKNLTNVLVLTLALNFLALAGAAGWLFQSKHLNRERVHAIREIVFPHPAPASAATQPVSEDAATTQPILKLDELIARQSGRSAAEQVEFLQHTFDAQMAQLDRRQRELADLQRQVDIAKEQMTRDRATFDTEKSALTAREQQVDRLANDKGFQDSLARYQAMSGKQVKQIFMTLDDDTVMNYLQTMEPRTAARIIKEFKAPDEVQRIQKVLEKMRVAQARNAGAQNSAQSPQSQAQVSPNQ